MRPKTPREKRTLTRARLDAAVYSLYLQFYDGKPRAVAVTKFLKNQAKLGTELLTDLRTLGRLTTTGTGRGSKHAWTGAPPTAELLDAVEDLRELRAARKAERTAARQAAKRSLQQAREILQPKAAPAAPDSDAPDDGWRRLDYALSLTDNVDLLLDFRNRVDRRLRQVRPTPPTLFDPQP